MSVDLRNIEESKRQMRRRLAALPFAEKLQILEELRERSLALAANPLRRRRTLSTPGSEGPGCDGSKGHATG
ncbi:MAG: hypothetical protein AAB676_08785 [Verrucomicrobiota bacterium]